MKKLLKSNTVNDMKNNKPLNFNIPPKDFKYRWSIENPYFASSVALDWMEKKKSMQRQNFSKERYEKVVMAFEKGCHLQTVDIEKTEKMFDVSAMSFKE